MKHHCCLIMKNWKQVTRKNMFSLPVLQVCMPQQAI
uniref:Uncharacterized protein n=1 Tax=Romanomermis culicivorax TaxID=13658 RepID=A0A915IW70_ROMCU